MTLGQKVLLFFQNRVFRAIFLVICLILAVGIIRSVVTIWQKRGIVAERKTVLEAEQAKHALLERQLQEATSTAFIERTAREKLGLVKPGETVVILDTSKLQNQDEKTGNSSLTPSWREWWQLFF